jgi:peptidylprolyl isomerase
MQSRIVVLVVLLVGLVAAIVLTQVGGDEDDDGGSANTDTSTKPVVEVPDGAPPTELETTDLVEGDGAEAKEGDTVSMQYVGVNYSDGSEFDSSWETGQPFEFELGAGGVIPGWDEGIPGMKVGGRRELVIPPDLGYGPTGQPPDIGPNETLVFIVDLVDVK